MHITGRGWINLGIPLWRSYREKQTKRKERIAAPGSFPCDKCHCFASRPAVSSEGLCTSALLCKQLAVRPNSICI